MKFFSLFLIISIFSCLVHSQYIGQIEGPVVTHNRSDLNTCDKFNELKSSKQGYKENDMKYLYCLPLGKHSSVIYYPGAIYSRLNGFSLAGAGAVDILPGFYVLNWKSFEDNWDDTSAVSRITAELNKNSKIVYDNQVTFEGVQFIGLDYDNSDENNPKLGLQKFLSGNSKVKQKISQISFRSPNNELDFTRDFCEFVERIVVNNKVNKLVFCVPSPVVTQESDLGVFLYFLNADFNGEIYYYQSDQNMFVHIYNIYKNTKQPPSKILDIFSLN